jgi:DNA-binding GntR family transcriptional regulator
MLKIVNYNPDFKQPETIANAVAHSLENAIIKGKIKSGTRLVERDLAEKYKVSRLPIREAIRELQAKGLVSKIPHKGAVVSKNSLEEIKDICEVKCTIESFSASEAAKKITEKDIKELHLLIDEMEYQIKKKNFIRYSEIAYKFHCIIHIAHGNKTLYEIYKKLDNQIYWHRFTYLHYPERVKCSFEQHKNILKALCNKDSKNAELLMKKHIKEGEEILLKILTEEKNN